MYLIGLTGGIGSGKSFVARELARLGAHVIDADEVARDAVALGSTALLKIVEQFGPEVLLSNGELNRQQLAELVFDDRAALASLNAIVHPAVRKLAATRIAGAAENADSVVVYDVPLLIEAGVNHDWDLVVVTLASESTRIARLIDLRGMSREEAQKRISTQASDEQRREIADVIIDTEGTTEQTLRQVESLWRDVQKSLEQTL